MLNTVWQILNIQIIRGLFQYLFYIHKYLIPIIFMRMIKSAAQRLTGFDKPTVWSIMTPLAIQTKSINLGQGFPSWHPPQFFIDALSKNMLTKNLHQYTRAFGTPELVNAIGRFHKRYQKLNPLTDICVTSGGVQALYSTILGIVNPGEEVILLAPFYDCYQAQVKIAGGIPRSISLKPKYMQSKQQIKNRKQGRYASTEKDDWDIDWELLKKTLNSKTKALILNSPHNPTGKIFTEEDLLKLAGILKEFPNVVIIEDSVYQGLTFDEFYMKPLPKLALVPGFYQRCIGVYSAGKIFAATGVRIGWVVGPSHLVKSVMSIHQYNVFCQNDACQRSCAESLDLIGTNSYMKDYTDLLVKNRNLLIDVLLDSKYDFNMWIPKGGFFIMTDISKIQVNPKYYVDQKTNEKHTKDMAFCIQLAKEDGVVAIPCSSFFDLNDKSGQNLVRFAFCKDQEMIIQAGKRMKQK